MGASGWKYFVPYEDDVTHALRSLHERIFAAGEFFWENEDDEDYDPLEPFPAPKPASLEQLDETRLIPEFWDVGTHSALDLYRVIAPSDNDADGTLRQAPADEIASTFGTATPTRAQFEDTFDYGGDAVPFARKWSGLYLVLADDNGAPAEIAIWGYSGD